MPLFVAQKRSTSGSTFVEKMNHLSVMQSVAHDEGLRWPGLWRQPEG